MSNQQMDEYSNQIEDCETREERLTAWERGFIDSLRNQIENRGAPSAKQAETLNSIWERATARG